MLSSIFKFSFAKDIDKGDTIFYGVFLGTLARLFNFNGWMSFFSKALKEDKPKWLLSSKLIFEVEISDILKVFDI